MVRGRGHWNGQRRGEAVTTTETPRPQTQPQAEVAIGKPAGMLVAVVRDESGRYVGLGLRAKPDTALAASEQRRSGRRGRGGRRGGSDEA